MLGKATSHLCLDIRTKQPTCSRPEFFRQRKFFRQPGRLALMPTGLPVRIILIITEEEHLSKENRTKVLHLEDFKTFCIFYTYRNWCKNSKWKWRIHSSHQTSKQHRHKRQHAAWCDVAQWYIAYITYLIPPQIHSASMHVCLTECSTKDCSITAHPA